MRETLLNTLIIGALALLLAACGAEISDDADDFEPSAGSADFTTFVAVGDSLTAGYADGALYRNGQVNSYPAILAQQFALVGGGAFAQPLMPVGATGSLTIVPFGDLGLDDRRVLIGTGNPARPVTPVEITPSQPTAIDLPALTGPFNNMGVPGAKSFHLVSAGYGNPALLPAANPFFVRFASATGASVIGDAIAQMPSFFVLWIGNNDILSYATGGGTGIDRNAIDDTAVAGYGPGDITDDTAFAGIYSAPGTGLIDLLKTMTNKGVLVNIPDVSTIPFFTTVPYNAIPLTSGDVAMLAPLAAGYNAVLAGLVPGTISQAEADRRQLSFTIGQNPILIIDETLVDISGSLPPAPSPLSVLGQARPATADDFILLTALPKIGVDAGGFYGISVPMADLDVLIPSEINAIETARQAYNATIKAAADGDPDLVLFDAAAKVEELNTTGILYGSGGISSTFVQGGGFSLDGVHPTARGYAVIANEIIKVINQGFGANIPPVDPGQYTTVFYQ